ncbi:MAG: hypothetical protein NUV31_06850 [Dehalococcoidales bacterium]|jgi:hypothetical protein|nr:hypothetical protein [Dehalococcoidales bacterium]
MNRFWKFLVDLTEKAYEARRDSLLKTYGLQDISGCHDSSEKNTADGKVVKQLEVAESRS